jgi:hypothetical protein
MMFSPTPIPRRSPAPPMPPTPASPPNPLRYRANPAPTPPRPIRKIGKRKAITIEQRGLCAEKKRKPREKKGRYCKVCKLECNLLVVFANHLKFRGHLYRSGLTTTLPQCEQPRIPGQGPAHHHKGGRAHLRVFVQTSKKDKSG